MKSIKDIESAGAFVSGQLIKKSGVWKRYSEVENKIVEDEVSFFIREASYHEYKKVIRGDGEVILKDPENYIEELTIASCVRLGENGEEKITFEQACRLESALLKVFWDACTHINSQDNQDPKTLPPRKNSGANLSSTESAEEQSGKRRGQSATTKRSSGKPT